MGKARYAAPMRFPLLISALLLSPSLGRAQTPTPPKARDAVTKAKGIYADGVKLFKAGDFTAALAQFEDAYLLDPSPILIFNMARANEELGQARRAITYFERYLDRVPDEAGRTDIEDRLRRLRNWQAQTKQQGSDDWLGWTLLGVGGASMLTGGVLLSIASDAADEASALSPLEKDDSRHASLRSDYRAFRASGWIGLGVGAVLVGTGGALLLYSDESHKVALVPTAKGFTIGGVF